MPHHITALVGNNMQRIPDSKVCGANIGPIWGRQDPDGPHVGPMNFAVWNGYPEFDKHNHFGGINSQNVFQTYFIHNVLLVTQSSIYHYQSYQNTHSRMSLPSYEHPCPRPGTGAMKG